MSDFNKNSSDAMFATILLRLDQQDKDRLLDVKERTEFRALVVERFDEGTLRMERIEAQTLKTNGRVTKLEAKWGVVTAKIAGALLVLGALWQVGTWLYEQGFRVTH